MEEIIINPYLLGWLGIITVLIVGSCIISLGTVAINKKQEEEIATLHARISNLEDYIDDLMENDDARTKKDLIYNWIMSDGYENQEKLSHTYIKDQLIVALTTYQIMEELYRKHEGHEEETDS